MQVSTPSSSRIPDGRVRRIPLTGAVNFRDLGGYPTTDGRHVKWGLLFRSDSLAELSDADLVAVDALQLRTLCDMRHESERQLKPNRVSAQAATRTHAIGFYPHGAEGLMKRVRARLVNVDEARSTFTEMYRRLPVDNVAHYAQLLDILSQPGALPALIHCTSGKDRTGFAVAMVLLAVGVSREVIAEDYALTNQYRRDLSFMLGQDVDPAVLDMVKRADPDFLRGAFEVIDQHWGGDEGFVRDGLRLSPERRDYLKGQLLES